MCSQKNVKIHIFLTHLANEIAAICMELSNRSHSKNVKITEAATVCRSVQSQSLGHGATRLPVEIIKHYQRPFPLSFFKHAK